jgi:hypothetical protein
LLTLWVTRQQSALKRQQRIPASVGGNHNSKLDKLTKQKNNGNPPSSKEI